MHVDDCVLSIPTRFALNADSVEVNMVTRYDKGLIIQVSYNYSS